MPEDRTPPEDVPAEDAIEAGPGRVDGVGESEEAPSERPEAVSSLEPADDAADPASEPEETGADALDTDAPVDADAGPSVEAEDEDDEDQDGNDADPADSDAGADDAAEAHLRADAVPADVEARPEDAAEVAEAADRVTETASPATADGAEVAAAELDGTPRVEPVEKTTSIWSREHRSADTDDEARSGQHPAEAGPGDEDATVRSDGPTPLDHADGEPVDHAEAVQTPEAVQNPETMQAPEPVQAPESAKADEAPARPTFRDWLRPERTQVVVAIVLAVVAFGFVTQIHTRGQVDSYSSLRQSDLVGMLDGLNQESQRLQSELESLQTARDQLQSGQNNEALARAQAEDRLTALGILAGTIPAQGPGITITITDPQGKVKPAMILDALEEMRDAGGEVIQINGRIRVVASSWVGSGPSGIVVDGQPVSTPITMEVIGDPHSLEEAARFRGGLVSQITDPRVGGQVSIARSDKLSITSLHTVQSPQVARADEGSGTSTPTGN